MITEDELAKHIIAMVNQAGTAALGNNYARLLPMVEQGKWNGDLRVKAQNGHKGLVHSWIAFRLTKGQKQQGQRVNHYWGMRLRLVLQYWDKGDVDNSEKVLREELEAVDTYFKKRVDLGLDQSETGFMRHELLQETNRALQYAGDTHAHVVNLFLGCHLYEMVTPA